MTPRERVRALVKALPKVYPDAHCELDFGNPLELLVATILSAQCTDKRVNAVTPALFAKYRSAADYAGANEVLNKLAWQESRQRETCRPWRGSGGGGWREPREWEHPPLSEAPSGATGNYVQLSKSSGS